MALSATNIVTGNVVQATDVIQFFNALTGVMTDQAYTLAGQNAALLSVGRQGATNPALLVNSNTASSITGVSITAAASGGNVALAALGGTDESLLLSGKGAGIVQTTAATASATVGAFKAINSNASAVGMSLMLSNLSANNAANAAELGFSMNNSTPAELLFGHIRVTSTTVTASAETGQMLLGLMSAGSFRNQFVLSGGSTTAIVQGLPAASAGAARVLQIAGAPTAAANSDTLYGVDIGPGFAANSKTALNLYSLSIAANSTAPDNTSTKVAVIVGAQTGANASNIGVDIAAPSGATTNIGLRNAGTSQLAGVTTLCSATATPANGSAAAATLMGTTAAFGLYYGSGTPSVAAAQGSVYMRSDGSGIGSRLYVNTTGSTTWTAFTSAA